MAERLPGGGACVGSCGPGNIVEMFDLIFDGYVLLC